MPPKGRKSLALWQSCDSCGSILNAKDIDEHPQFCPPDLARYQHSFIREEELHSFLEDLDVKGLPPQLNKDVLDDIILLSQSAMQLCGFVIGFPVLVRMNGKSVFKKAWPTSEGTLTAVKMSTESLEIGWSCKLDPSNRVTVTKAFEKPNLAKEVYFDFEEKEDVSDSNLEILTHLLQSKTRHWIHFPGHHFKLSFYGKNVAVKFVSYVSENDDIVDQMGQMSINDKCFTPTNTTVFKLVERKKHKIEEEEKIIKFGGYHTIVEEIKENISAVLNYQGLPDRHASSGILIYGLNGTGKTLISRYLAKQTSVPIIEIQGMEIFSKYYGETESRLRQIFSSAIAQSPCVILVDNIEILCPKKGTDQEKRVGATFLSQFDAIQDKKIVVLATSSRPDDIESSLRRPGRLEYEIEIPVPTPSDRLAILEALVEDESLKETLIQIADSCHGFVGADLASVVTKAACRMILERRETISKGDLLWAHTQVKPSAMREISVQVPNVLWSDIGGQEELKLKLQQSVEWPLKYPESFKRLGIKPPKGVLMYGPPGCSKTLIAKALATETKLNFLSVKGSDIFSKWVGESERAMRDLFKKARNVAPAIIFLDEIDALGGERESSSSGGSAVQERVLSQLLTEMDGVQTLSNVIIIAATNRPDRIDKALLRPGRLDRLIYVPLPSANTRREILKLKFNKMPTDASVNLESLVYKTEGYSGAEVIAVCDEAAYNALEEDLDAPHLKMTHFDKALFSVTPRTPMSLLKLYDDYNNKK